MLFSRAGEVIRRRKFWALSLAGHLLLLAIAFLRDPVAPLKEPPAIFIDFPSLPPAKEGESAAPAAGGGGSEGGKAPRPPSPRSSAPHASRPKNALPPGWSWKPQIPATGTAAGGGPPNAGSAGAPDRPPGPGEAVYQFGYRMDVKAEGKFFPFAERLYRRLNTFIGYPPDFVEEHVQGDVNVHFKVNRLGQFQGPFLESDGDEDMLKVYTMAMVALALAEPLVEAADPGHELIPVAVHVRYRLLLPDEYAVRTARAHYKNTLQFERFGYTDAKPVKVARRFLEKYAPPIIPVPGGFYVDFVALYKRLKEKPHDDPDYRRSVRLDLDQQTMKQFLKKEGN